MSAARATRLGFTPHTPETHKCFFLHLAAALIYQKTQQVPSIETAQSWASDLLSEFEQEALPVADVLGEAPELMSQAESDLRVFLHDLYRADHDTDYRLPAAFPLPRLAKLRLCFARLTHNTRLL
jgi:hypothetical protein